LVGPQRHESDFVSNLLNLHVHDDERGALRHEVPRYLGHRKPPLGADVVRTPRGNAAELYADPARGVNRRGVAAALYNQETRA
jgi:hypothetical protein